MRCAEVRQFVRLYLDSELNTEHSFEVERHLQSCAECAGLFEAEGKFDDRLGRFLRRDQATRALWEKIEALIAKERVAAGQLVLSARFDAPLSDANRRASSVRPTSRLRRRR